MKHPRAPVGGRLLGVIQGSTVISVAKGRSTHFPLRRQLAGGAREGELVEYTGDPDVKGRLCDVRVQERLQTITTAADLRHIAAAAHGIEFELPESADAEAAAVAEQPVPAEPDPGDESFLTIDPADARDHDDAVDARASTDPGNPGGHLLRVAIADVARYVRVGGAIDRAARERGNSCYFPDRAAHMLPEKLAADLCSLHSGRPRAALVAEMEITAEGELVGVKFRRASIRVRRNLTYEECESLRRSEDAPDIRTLYAGYAALAKAREAREPLEIDLPERAVRIDPDGEVEAVQLAERLDSHRLIEEYMLLANTAAARVLTEVEVPFLRRIHPPPDPDGLDRLKQLTESLSIPTPPTRPHKDRRIKTQPADQNRLLEAARKLGAEETMALAVLRAQARAFYSAAPGGHYGLNLQHYTHFTSPIRRYADLSTHRALIETLGLGGEGGRVETRQELQTLADGLNERERDAVEAERETLDRCIAAHLEANIGRTLRGIIAGSVGAGLFVRIEETGTDGFVPRFGPGERIYRAYPSRTFHRRSDGAELHPGRRVRVRLRAASRLSGSIELTLLADRD